MIKEKFHHCTTLKLRTPVLNTPLVNSQTTKGEKIIATYVAKKGLVYRSTENTYKSEKKGGAGDPTENRIFE